jgi:lipopolysaccharide transport system ATP-binding protein
MPTPIISIENLGKTYRVKRPGNREGSGLRHALESGAKNLWKGLGRLVRGQFPFEAIPPKEEFWALKDIRFEVMPGDCVGIIGRNGAGKSTLLKILSRITEPSTGRAVLRGRVGSLLEVGTGFHPELTGRENIFLNGAILGMRRHEINKRMDEIVAFAEVDEFLDTPVKHYSSGMYMRLAFAVAAHLDSEILIVDEVLAVGDAQFQKKCLGKMGEVVKQGMVVLFVSHNIQIINSFCNVGIHLENGRQKFYGEIAGAIKSYGLQPNYSYINERCGLGTFIYKADLITIYKDEDILLKVDIYIKSQDVKKVAIDICIEDVFGNKVGMGSLGTIKSIEQIILKTELVQIQVECNVSSLAIGEYNLSIDLTIPHVVYIDRMKSCLFFEIIDINKQIGRCKLDSKWAKGLWELPLRLVFTEPCEDSI